MPSEIGLQASLQYQTWDLPSLLLKARLAKAIEEGSARYPIHRSLRLAARGDLDLHFDRLATEIGWRAQRLDASTLVLEHDDLFVIGRGGRKSTYCSCSFGIWARDAQVADKVRDAILGTIGTARILEPMFSIDWHFLTAKNELQNAVIEEMADDVLYDSAYPAIDGGVKQFISAYLDAAETVLVLQGAPGSGKTRLIRTILGEMSRRRDGGVEALYTGDKKALESDEIFVQFITGTHHAFIVEDADHVLRPRAQGNEHLHRFLTIADGIVRAQGRKIIFSTNLPNIGDLDDALLRPGRCFARVATRDLTFAEAQALTMDLCAAQGTNVTEALKRLAAKNNGNMSVAEVYRAVND
jgi:ATPase family associated with various cellular activities (AAA)